MRPASSFSAIMLASEASSKSSLAMSRWSGTGKTVLQNNPATSAYSEARRLVPDETAFPIVSLGTGQLARRIPFEEAKEWGKVQAQTP
jgi:hypothetical protein